MVVVVGGQSKNIGKTALVCALIRAVPEASWCAVKITGHSHGEPEQAVGASGHAYTLEAAYSPSATDSGRFLEAGAAASYWLRHVPGRLPDAMPAVRQLISQHQNTIVESNSLVAYLEPDLYLLLLDPQTADWKASAIEHWNQVSLFVVVDRGPAEETERKRLLAKLPPHKPFILLKPPLSAVSEVAVLMRDCLAARRQ